MKSTNNNFSAIILAAGQGKRMRSKKSKVLHTLGREPMIKRTVKAISSLKPAQIIVVANPQNIKSLKKILKNVEVAIQNKPLGTADAAKIGLTLVSKNIKDIAVFYADDTAFYTRQTIKKIIKQHKNTNAKITFVTLIKKDPHGLGRIVRFDGKLTAIVEEKDANSTQKKIKEVNDGIYFFNREFLSKSLQKLEPSPKTGELYITDLVELALTSNQKVETYTLKDDGQWHGINTKEELLSANVKLSKNIHFMGASGSGASAVASIAQGYGYNVSGCDVNPNSPYSNSLNIPVKKGHSLRHLENISLLIVSPAILKSDPKNLEITYAKKSEIPTLTWQKFQGKILQKDKFVISVAGAYGKSTTTAMVAKILTDLGKDPTCEIGAQVVQWGKNYRIGNSKYYVCEADEYNNNFLNYYSDIAVVLNTNWDHPDYFKSKKDLKNSYIKFINNIKPNGCLITTNSVAKSVASSLRGDIKIIKIANSFNTDLKIIGDFRKQNASAALAVAGQLKLDTKSATHSLKNFSGVARRLELKGKVKKTMFFDDYAVQPYTIKSTANALAQKYKNKKFLLIIEPHTFSRIKVFFEDFVKSLKEINTDKIFITDIYAAREKGNTQKPSRELAKKIGSKAQFTGSVETTAKIVASSLNKYGLICSMGAGNSYKLYDLVSKLK